MIQQRLAIDVGGTFVDFVLLDEETGDIRIEKAPSSGLLDSSASLRVSTTWIST